PTNTFLTYNYSLEGRTVYLYKPYAFSRFDVTAKAFWVFKNFWDLTILANTIPIKERNYLELRTPGRYLEYPLNYFIEATGSTDSRRKAYISYDLIWAHAPEFDNTYYTTDLTFRYRFTNSLTLSLEGVRNEEKNQLG